MSDVDLCDTRLTASERAFLRVWEAVIPVEVGRYCGAGPFGTGSFDYVVVTLSTEADRPDAETYFVYRPSGDRQWKVLPADGRKSARFDSFRAAMESLYPLQLGGRPGTAGVSR